MRLVDRFMELLKDNFMIRHRVEDVFLKEYDGMPEDWETTDSITEFTQVKYYAMFRALVDLIVDDMTGYNAEQLKETPVEAYVDPQCDDSDVSVVMVWKRQHVFTCTFHNNGMCWTNKDVLNKALEETYNHIKSGIVKAISREEDLKPENRLWVLQKEDLVIEFREYMEREITEDELSWLMGKAGDMFPDWTENVQAMIGCIPHRYNPEYVGATVVDCSQEDAFIVKFDATEDEKGNVIEGEENSYEKKHFKKWKYLKDNEEYYEEDDEVYIKFKDKEKREEILDVTTD